MNNRTTAQPGNRRSLFWRLWWRSLTIKRPQAGLAIASVLVGAAVASMLLNLYGDVRRKMTQEFRAYGPNVILAPGDSREAPSAAASEAPAGLMEAGIAERLAPVLARTKGAAAVPVLYAVTVLKRLPPDPRLPEMENVVAVGTDFEDLRQLYPAWRVELKGDSLKPGEAVIGARVASLLHLGAGDSFELASLGADSGLGQTETNTYRVRAILSTGASEDEQVFVALDSLQALTRLEGKISLVEVSLPGETAEIERIVNDLQNSLAGVEVRPVRQIVYSSGKVLDTIRWLTVSLTGLILVIIALSVMATMTTIVLERKKDIAVMKALGASDHLVMDLFLSEGAGLGLIGAVAGFALGVVLARGVAAELFGVALTPPWWTLPVVALAGTLLAVAATIFPVRIVRGVRPASVLQGE